MSLTTALYLCWGSNDSGNLIQPQWFICVGHFDDLAVVVVVIVVIVMTVSFFVFVSVLGREAYIIGYGDCW